MLEMATLPYILQIPEVALEKIFSFLTYDEIAKNRIVCRTFNETGSKLLSRGFFQLEKRHSAIYKRVKSGLPRRESERKTHPLARHCDILQGVETRISMLNMTYSRHIIDHKAVCFIPGKVLDEIQSVLNIVESNKPPPRTQEVMQELRDLSSMAIEHFDEVILPGVKEKLEQRTGSPEKILKDLEMVAGSLGATYTPITGIQGLRSRRLLLDPQVHQSLTNEIVKIKKATKLHKGHINHLRQTSKRMSLKIRNDSFTFSSQLRKQSNLLREQHLKLKKQEIKILQQSNKIREQEATIADIKRHLEEWEHKYNDLTAELVRARDEILRKTSNSQAPALLHSPPILPVVPPTCFKTNIKPRTSQVLSKTHLSFDFERKRKPISRLTAEVPAKRQRSPIRPKEDKQCDDAENYEIKIPDLANFEKDTANMSANAENNARVPITDSGGSPPGNLRSIFSKSLDNLLIAPLANTVKARKRKMTEDIDLK